MTANFKSYIALLKPGIVFSNLFVASSGFFLASFGVFNLLEFLYFLIALFFILISSTAFNNYIDKDIDGNLSERTKARFLKIQNLSSVQILSFAIIFGVFGVAIMLILVNYLATIFAIIAFFIYVIVYSIWLKRHSVYSTFVGAFSGAAPPLIGYVAFKNDVDIDGLLLFLLMLSWQMYHFFAIAIFRLKDYSKLSIPLLPVVKGILVTKKHMFYWLITTIIFSVFLKLLSNLGFVYLIYVILMALVKLYVIVGYKTVTTEEKDFKWAKRVFLVSILDILLLGVSIIIDSVFIM